MWNTQNPSGGCVVIWGNESMSNIKLEYGVDCEYFEVLVKAILPNKIDEELCDINNEIKGWQDYKRKYKDSFSEQDQEDLEQAREKKKVLQSLKKVLNSSEHSHKFIAHILNDLITSEIKRTMRIVVTP